MMKQQKPEHCFPAFAAKKNKLLAHFLKRRSIEYQLFQEKENDKKTSNFYDGGSALCNSDSAGRRI
jgi:hypothetical protein